MALATPQYRKNQVYHEGIAQTEMLNLVQAVRSMLYQALEIDEKVVVLGEDVGKNGGVFRATEGLQDVFGEHRVIDTPLSESGFTGAAIGMALAGLKPIVEIQFLGFIYPAFEQIVSHAARMRMRTLGHYTVPLVIRAPYGAGVRAPEIHSDSTEAFFTHMPGLKVVVPSNPYDAKGLLWAALEDPDPVIFLEPMRLYRSIKGPVPKEKYTVPLGQATLLKEGKDVSLFTWGAMVPLSQKAVEQAAINGISVELIDLRTLYPLDRDMIVSSIKKTGRAVIVQEAHESGSVAQDILALIQEEAFYEQKAPPVKVSGFDVPVPFFALEDAYLPTVDRILEGIKQSYQDP